MAERILGIDVGGSSIKSALVDVESGKILATAFSVATPKPATPPQLLDVFGDVVRHFAPVAAIGLAMPSVVQHGVTRTAANIDAGWLGFPIERELHERTRQPVKVLNDAPVRDTLVANSHEIVGSTPAEFAAVMRDDFRLWGDLASKLGARVD